MTTTAVSVKLTADEKRRLAAVAKKTKRSAHFLMREALMAHLKQIEARLSFVAEAEEAWRDYKETGLFISGEAMEKWAASGGGKLPPLERTWEK